MSNFGSSKKFVSFGMFGGFAVAASVLLMTACSEQAKAKLNFLFKDSPKPGIVAKIGGQEITEESLIGEDKLDLFDLKKREYDLRMDRVKKKMVEILIGNEAKAAGMSIEDYINKKIAANVKISKAETDAFIKEKHIPENQLNPQINERIQAYLSTMKKEELVTAHLTKLTKNQPVEIYFTKPKMEVNVEIGNAPVSGKENAPVTIVEFSDFQCPFCSRGAETINQVKKKYGNKVRVAFKHFPLPMHQQAKPAAEASMCVNEQGSDKFWKFHDLAFKNQDKLDNANLEKYAKDSGADVKKYNECIASKKYVNYVLEDMKSAEKYGVKSTPTFIVAGQIISGALPIESFSEVIDEALANQK